MKLEFTYSIADHEYDGLLVWDPRYFFAVWLNHEVRCTLVHGTEGAVFVRHEDEDIVQCCVLRGEIDWLVAQFLRWITPPDSNLDAVLRTNWPYPLP
jgi:hypothetical protein